MTDQTIDPYSHYLGLSARSGPPNHYELLLLETFCAQHERIHEAARKQFRLIKPFQDHPVREEREAIQDVMNAIATARVVLTDPDRKEAYDIALAEELGIDREACLAEQVAAPLPEFRLAVIAGPSQVGRSLDLVEGSPCTIGADPRCSVPLIGGRAGDRHCHIAESDDEWLLHRDRDDALVCVNGKPCREFVLQPGDRIDAAGYRFEFRNADASGDGRTAGAPAPLSMILQRGPCVQAPILNVLPPQAVIIGRGRDALWQLAERSVSVRHCRVQSLRDCWEIEDLESEAGTRVNGTEVLRHVLRDRDIVTVGSFEILVSLRA